MAYFLKKTKNKKGLYLQIYESFYDPNRGHTAHKSYRSLGYEADLIESGIKNPLDYFQLEVDELNRKLNLKKNKDAVRQISGETPQKYLGHFPIKSINESLNVKGYVDLLQTQHNFEFNVFDVMSSLVYARMIKPCSKSKTFHDVVPLLFEGYDYSSSQMYSAIEFLGSEYEKLIEIYNVSINKKYKFNTSVSYFDCTNFYFEIDREDDLRRKGPSKENRRDPIVGMGLLLDANQIPMGMKLFPGNQSEKPVLNEVVNHLKSRQNITGRTIRVADKGLNTANNIYESLKLGDGYIFSKSVKMLPETEKTWVLLENDYVPVLDSNGKTKYFIKECIDRFPYSITVNNKKTKVEILEKRVVSYNPKLAAKKKAEILKQVEKAKKACVSKAKRDEYGDSGKYVTFESVDEEGNNGKVSVSINYDKIDKDLELAGYNLIVTSETKMSFQEIYNTYHNLWRIEESFRVMKSDLDARPVYLQKEDSIYGHFLICYLSVVLLRILQLKIFNDDYSSSEILRFIKEYKVIQASPRKYINITKSSKFIKRFSQESGLPIANYFLNNTQIKMMLNYRFR